MKRLAASLVAAAALLGSLAGTALAQGTNSQNAFGAGPGMNAQYDRNHQNDPGDHSGQGWGSDRGRFDRADLGGRWAADNGSADSRGNRGDFRGRGPMREMMLPDFIRIDQRPSMIRIADARNRPLKTIMLGGKFDSRGGDSPDYVLGRWHGSTLVVESTGPRGGTITQSFALQDRGRTLVVRTRREGFGPRTMEMTSTYHRA